MMTRKSGDICHEFGLGRPPEKSEIDLLIVNNLGIIQAFICYFETEMHSVIDEMHQNPVSLKNDPLIQKSQEILPSLECDEAKKLAFLKKIAPEKMPERLECLTKRERACLEHILLGKTATQIAAQLHLSPRTIETHLDNIKGKLGCNSKSELIEILQIYRDFNFLKI